MTTKEKVMKKVVLFALLLAAVTAASAHAINLPMWNATYTCEYDNYSGPASDPGWSRWVNPIGNPPLIYATEQFKVPYLSGQDNHRVAWAKPVHNYYYGFTTWEFTDSPVQCKDTRVYPGAYYIVFQNCTDGHTRYCYIP
jgi:hypothetical protein